MDRCFPPFKEKVAIITHSSWVWWWKFDCYPPVHAYVPIGVIGYCLEVLTQVLKRRLVLVQVLKTFITMGSLYTPIPRTIHKGGPLHPK